jgi:predicted hydrocarbon binding protein
MFDVFKKLLMARQISFDSGEIKLLEQSMLIVPMKLMVIIHKELEKQGKELLLYTTAKSTGKEFMLKAAGRFGMKKQDLIKWSFDLVGLGGYGQGQLHALKTEGSYRVNIMLLNSPYARMYGKSSKPIDIIYKGFISGMGDIVSERDDIHTVETKCISKGDKLCEFISMPKEEFDKKDPIVKEQLGGLLD